MHPLEVPEDTWISLETLQRKWASSSLEGRTSWISRVAAGALDLRQVLSTYDWDHRDPLWWPQERPVPRRLFVGLLGVLSHRCWGLRSCVESVKEPEDSSPVPTWIFGHFWSLPRGVSPRLEWGHARALSSRAVAAVSHFPFRGSRDLWLSL